MIRPVLFTTEKGNRYLYSPSRNRMNLCHPLIQFLHEQSPSDLRKWLDKVKTDGNVVLDGTGTFSFREVSYQVKKYSYLKKQGFFKEKPHMNLKGKLLPGDVEDNLTRTKQLIFEVTEDCNLNCLYCTYSKYYVNTQERSKRDFDFGEAKKALKYFLEKRQKTDKSTLTVSFYGGEPLKSVRLIGEIIQYLRTLPGNQIPFKFTMTSNGVYLKKYISFLAEHHVEVGISLDGDSFGNSYRVTKNNRPSYDVVIRNLDFVREHYPEYFEKNISFMSVMHNHNNYQSLFSFFKEKYNKIPTVSDINTINISEEFRDEFYRTFFSDKKDDRNDPAVMKTFSLRHPRVKDMTDMVARYSGMVFKNHYMMMVRTKDLRGRKKFIPTATCSPFSLRVYMTTDGSILPCEHISREFKVGNIGPEGVSIDPVGISETYNRYFKKIRTYCEKCYLADNCKECVFNTNISSGKPSCEYYMSERKFRNYLARHYSIIEEDYKFFTRVVKDAFREQG